MEDAVLCVRAYTRCVYCVGQYEMERGWGVPKSIDLKKKPPLTDGAYSQASTSEVIIPSTCACVFTTPLGRPVVPLDVMCVVVWCVE